MRTALATLRFEPIREERIESILLIERLVNSAPWSERSFRNELDHKEGIFLLALLNGEVVGYGGIWLIIDEAHVTTVAVHPDLQRQGIGQSLLEELLKRAKEKGMTCSTLEVRAGNKPAIALYEKLGFITAATRKSYYPDNKEDALVMWLYKLEDWQPS